MDMDRADQPNASGRYEIRLSHVKLSPYAHQAEQATIAWMRDAGLLPEQNYLENVTRMAVWAYAGYSHPFASYEELVLYTKYITLWLLWDDVVVEQAPDLSAIKAGIQEAFGADDAPLRSDDPYLAGWRSMADGYRALGASRDFVRRIGRKMTLWVRLTAAENRSVHGQEAVSAWSHLRKRVVNIGIIPTAQILDVHMRDFDRVPAAQRAVAAAAAVVALVNELVSVEKDRHRMNLLTLVQRERQCSWESAFAQVVRMYRASLMRLASAVSALPADLAEWGERVRYMAEGFSYWHLICPRYDPSRLSWHVSTADAAADADWRRPHAPPFAGRAEQPGQHVLGD